MFQLMNFIHNKLFEKYGVEFHIYSGAYFKRHNHDGYWEMFIVTNGRTVQYFRNEEKPIGRNYVQLMRPEDVHCFIDCGVPCTHISISFDKNVMRNLLDIIDVELYRKLSEYASAVCTEISDAECDEIAKKIDLLTTLPEQENNYVATELKFIFFNVLQKICANIFKEKRGYPSIVREAINLMQTRYADNLTIDDICRNLNCTHISLLRQFKQHTGKTVINYFLDLRLEKAFTMLVSTNYNVIEICSLVGIDSISYFNKKFKEKYGFTPTTIKHNKPSL